MKEKMFAPRNTHTKRSTYFAPKTKFFGDLLRINMAPLWLLRVYGNLREVLAGGEDVNCKDEENWTALMCAMHNETFVRAANCGLELQ